MTSCPLFKGKRVVIGKDDIHVPRPQQQQPPQQQQRRQQQKQPQPQKQQQQLLSSLLQQLSQSPPTDTWASRVLGSSAQSAPALSDDMVQLLHLLMIAVPMLVQQTIASLRQEGAHHTVAFSAPVQPSSTSTTTPTSASTSTSMPGPGAVHIAPATSTSVIPAFATPKPKLPQRPRATPQQSIEESLARSPTPTAKHVAVHTNTATPTCTTTPTSTTPEPITSETATISAPTGPSKPLPRAPRPDYDIVVEPAYKKDYPTITEQEESTDGVRYLLVWPMAPDKPEWMTYDEVYHNHTSSLSRWNDKGLAKWMKAKQKQQPTSSTSNQYSMIEIDQDDVSMEEKFDHETQGNPGCSQDDTAPTPQTLKRGREATPSPVTSSNHTATNSTPTSACQLSGQMGRTKKKRTASKNATQAIAQQQEQEQAQDQYE